MVITIYDIETSGLIERAGHKTTYPDIYQFGFIRVTDKWDVVGSGCLWLYDPETYTPFNPLSGASKVTGITEEQLKSHESEFLQNSATMYALLNDGPIVGKNNLSFDNPVVTAFFQKYKPKNVRPFKIGPTIDVQSYAAPYWQQHLVKSGNPAGALKKKGTLDDYMKMIGYTELDIRKMAETIGVKIDTSFGYHNALYDAMMTLITYSWLANVKKASLRAV